MMNKFVDKHDWVIGLAAFACCAFCFGGIGSGRCV